jgi:transcriptional regulator GlxA family with amidase domain
VRRADRRSRRRPHAGRLGQPVGASERTLALFERELGMGFGHWRQQVRLAHAAR